MNRTPHHAETRLRVERIMRRSFTEHDISKILRFARDHCGSRQIVKEIGHFDAHLGERDKGFTVNSAREWQASATMMFFFLQNKKLVRSLPVHEIPLPSAAKLFFQTACGRFPRKMLIRDSQLSVKEATRSAKCVAEKLEQKEDGTWRLPRRHDLSLQERQTLQAITRLFTMIPAFDGAKLANEFCQTLQVNGLIDGSELKAHRAWISQIVQLYALITMHNRTVRLDEFSSASLAAAVSERTLKVVAMLPITTYHERTSSGIFHAETIDFSTPIYSTELRASEFLAPDLDATFLGLKSLELTSEGLIRSLT